MRMMTQAQIAEAERLRDGGGRSWREIGRILGFKPETLMAAVDPIYAEKRRQQMRDWRAKNGRKPVQQVPRRELLPKPVQQSERIWSLKSSEGVELGIRAITKTTTRYTGRGVISVPLSLPYIPSLYRQPGKDTHSDA